MEHCVLWTLANIFVFSVSQVYGSLPIPVLHFEENIIEDDEDTSITCTLPYNDYPDVKLVIKGNTTIKDCTPRKGNYPNVTCTVEVTREIHEMEFTCEAEFKTQSLPKKMNIRTEPEFTDCPDKVVWIEGQENSFHCQAKGYPLPNVTCEKNTIYTSTEKFTAMRNMSGKYICRATNFDTIIKTVTVSVEYKPKVLNIKVSPPLHGEGDWVEITCEADGVPDPTYSWKTPSSDLKFSADNRTVTINSLQMSHLGNYQCIVENKHGTNNETKKLNLAVKPRISRFDIEPSTQVFEGANVTITCEISGSPPPSLSWITPSDVQMSQDKRTVKIWGVTKKHVGSYTCKTQNEHGIDTQSRQLSLAVKPHIVQIKVQPSTSVAEGTNVTLTCKAEGVPPPTYSWETPTTSVQNSADNSVITIWNANKSHNGSYLCKAENKHGSATMTQKISVKVTEPKGNIGERQEPVTATILFTLISTFFFNYLY